MRIKEIMKILNFDHHTTAVKFMDRNKFKFTTETGPGGRFRVYSGLTEKDILNAKAAEDERKASSGFSSEAANDLFNLMHSGVKRPC